MIRATSSGRMPCVTLRSSLVSRNYSNVIYSPSTRTLLVHAQMVVMSPGSSDQRCGRIESEPEISGHEGMGKGPRIGQRVANHVQTEQASPLGRIFWRCAPPPVYWSGEAPPFKAEGKHQPHLRKGTI